MRDLFIVLLAIWIWYVSNTNVQQQNEIDTLKTKVYWLEKKTRVV